VLFVCRHLPANKELFLCGSASSACPVGGNHRTGVRDLSVYACLAIALSDGGSVSVCGRKKIGFELKEKLAGYGKGAKRKKG
jgi:hypothetical protein